MMNTTMDIHRVDYISVEDRFINGNGKDEGFWVKTMTVTSRHGDSMRINLYPTAKHAPLAIHDSHDQILMAGGAADLDDETPSIARRQAE